MPELRASQAIVAVLSQLCMTFNLIHNKFELNKELLRKVGAEPLLDPSAFAKYMKEFQANVLQDIEKLDLESYKALNDAFEQLSTPQDVTQTAVVDIDSVLKT